MSGNQRRMSGAPRGGRLPERVGADRESMRNNALLIPTELGRVRRPTYKVPDLRFGVPTNSRDGGAAMALGDWNTLKKPRQTSSGRPQRDFIRMNRAAMSSGMCNAREVRQFGTLHDFPKHDRFGRPRPSDTYPPPGLTFGLQTRPSTPLWEVLGNKYQRDWIEQRYDPREAEPPHEVKPSQGQVYETRASLVRRFVEPPQERPPWQMEKFKTVPALVTTFRSVKARDDAYAAHTLDKVSRTGTIGHGVYATSQT